MTNKCWTSYFHKTTSAYSLYVYICIEEEKANRVYFDLEFKIMSSFHLFQCSLWSDSTIITLISKQFHIIGSPSLNRDCKLGLLWLSYHPYFTKSEGSLQTYFYAEKCPSAFSGQIFQLLLMSQCAETMLLMPTLVHINL